MAQAVLDGAYLAGSEPPVFRRIAPPSAAQLQALVERIAERIGRALERQGVLCRDAESSYLAVEDRHVPATCYSYRNTLIGSTRDARRAGT